MKKIIMGTGLVCLLAACQNSTEKKHETMTDSSMQEMDHTGGTVNEMKTLMNGMMMKMHGQQATGDNDIDFAAMMLEHHKGAVAMAKLELDKGKDTAMKQFAQAVINAQEKEISFMNDFIAKTQKKISPDATNFQEGLAASMKAMMEDSTRSYNDTDKDFAAQMIPHHQSAVGMAKNYLRYGENKELKKMSRDIVDSQSREIGWLKDWLKM
ncbi:MAG: DUF305 domain-containing protein [Chitinophagaceae bacterium]